MKIKIMIQNGNLSVIIVKEYFLMNVKPENMFLNFIKIRIGINVLFVIKEKIIFYNSQLIYMINIQSIQVKKKYMNVLLVNNKQETELSYFH